jgi:hypothetical protein
MPIEPPKPVVKGRPFLGRHVANEGIREWFVREGWLLTDREVQSMVMLQRSVAARYYNEGELDDPPEQVGDAQPASCSGDDLMQVPRPECVAPPEAAPRELHSA